MFSLFSRFVPVHLIVTGVGLLPKHKFRDMRVIRNHGKDCIKFHDSLHELPATPIDGYYTIAI